MDRDAEQRALSEAGEKAFDATPRRIAKAKREGNVARSSELAANVAFAAAGLSVVAIALPFGGAAAGALVRSETFHSFASSAIVFALGLVPVGIAAIAGALASIVQNGGLVFASVVPKFERLNPIEGGRRVLSRETLGHSLRAASAFACATVAMIPVLTSSASVMLGTTDLEHTAAQAWSASQHLAAAAGTVGLLFSFVEYGAARSSWLRRLRMSFEERKRELKEEEGDVVARGRRRSFHRALLRGGVARVREAAFVVVNPTHVAVALAYRPPCVPVPEILVRAADEAAMRVRELAEIYGIAIVSNAGLARALYRDGTSGAAIPRAHYVAVAEVVSALHRSGELAG